MEDMKPTKREEEFLRGIARAAAGEESSVPTPVWDYEKRLYDIWLAAKGEYPIYNLPVHTEHPDTFYNAIRDALVEGSIQEYDGSYSVTPSEQTQTLLTNGKKMVSDVTVNPIPSSYVQPSGTVSITENGTVDVTGYATANVNVSGGSAVEVPQKDVNFRDYDGTIVASYTASEFASLTEMPANPSHDGLTAQGWTYTLAAAKAAVSASGSLEIGQMYTTSDGKTRLYITIPENAPAHARTLTLKFRYTSGNVTVDFGDNSETVTTNTVGEGNEGFASLSHTYLNTGDYCIAITPNNSSLSLINGYIFDQYSNENKNVSCWLKRVEIGDNVGSISPQLSSPTGAFYGCVELKDITIPLGTRVNDATFQGCVGIKTFTFKSGDTSVPQSFFNGCSNLQFVALHDDITSIGKNAFLNCFSLQSVDIPRNVTDIGSAAFYGCYGLREIHLRADTPPSVGSSTTFYGIQTSCKIYVPSASVNTYKAASGWSTYASQIYGE